jgi:carbon-monoxide dehydrogenase small subunit
MKHSVKFKLNGTEVEVLARDNMTLLDLLRDVVGLTGTKKGCEEGECGACTVMFDGRPINSCQSLAREAEGHEVITIEGIATNGKLHPVQQQFIEKWALQCGYCKPGMIMSA